MCGIAGLISPALGQAEREAAVTRMIERESHRGPDDRGLVSHGPATLGMCRLAIIDPAHGHQPMSSPDGRYHLVFNGAIYNYRELRPRLAAAGWEFRTDCDTEVLLAALALEGAACLPRLRGMFAFALWDARERKLMAARDPFGIKPLYYARLREGGLLLSLGTQRPPRQPDSSSGRSIPPPPRSISRGSACRRRGRSIGASHNLRPGHCSSRMATAGSAPSRGGTCRRRSGRDRRAGPGIFRELRLQLEDTIRAHRVADVPVGAFLSGGLDSTAIVALMARTGAAKLKTFTVVFDDPTLSERDPARVAATALGTDHHEELVTGTRVAADLPRLLEAFDSPTGDGINTYYVSQAARAGGVKVALSGLGGDELFGGYPSFRDLPRLLRFLPLWRRLPAGMRTIIVRQLQASAGARPRKLADFLAYGRDLHELAALQRRVLPEDRRRALLVPEVRAHGGTPRADAPAARRFCRRADRRRSPADHQRLGTAHLHDGRAAARQRRLQHGALAGVARAVHRPAVHRVAVVAAVRRLGSARSARKRRWPRPPPTSCLRRSARVKNRASPCRSRAGCARNSGRFSRRHFLPAHSPAVPGSNPAPAPGSGADFLSGRDSRAWSRVWALAMLVAFANRRPADENPAARPELFRAEGGIARIMRLYLKALCGLGRSRWTRWTAWCSTTRPPSTRRLAERTPVPRCGAFTAAVAAGPRSSGTPSASPGTRTARSAATCTCCPSCGWPAC